MGNETLMNETHLIDQSGALAKAGAWTTLTGAMGTWVLDNAEIISLSVVVAGFAVGVFFSWRRDKYLQQANKREQIEHDLRMSRRMTDIN